jgi:hypothetical protein
MLGHIVARVGTSFVTPGIARDIREFTDPYRRDVGTDENIGAAVGDRFWKSLMNAYPWTSQTLPPSVDAFGNYIKNQGEDIWDNLYNALIPIRKTKIKQDPVAAAFIANKVPVNQPDHMIKLPGHPELNLYKLDDGKGWVYHEYQKRVGKEIHKLVGEALNSSAWTELASKGLIGRNSEGSEFIRGVARKATQKATYEFLQDLSGVTEWTPKVEGKQVAETFKLDKTFDSAYYTELAKAFKESRMANDQEAQTMVNDAREEGVYKMTPPAQVKGLPPELKPQF